MEREQGPDQEHAFGHEDQEVQVAEGLEQFAEQQEAADPRDGEVPGVDAQALGATTEQGAGPARPTVTESAMGPTGDNQANAVSAISQKESLKRTARYQVRNAKRKAASLVRRAKRKMGKDWTAAELAEVMKTGGAEGVLRALNLREPQQGVQTLKDANQWEPLVAALPKGALAPKTREALLYLVSDNALPLADVLRLFEVRFNHRAEDVTGSWTLENMRTMWRQLDRLPAQDVTLNTSISTFTAISGGGGTYSGSVNIGQDTGGDNEYLEHTVRHEIGHGVHEQIKGEINQWLKNDMGFYPLANFRDWIEMAGGFPANFRDAGGQMVTVDDNWKTYLTTLVENYTNTSNWNPAKATPDTGETSDGQAAWAAMPATVKNACTQSKANWYLNYENFQVVGGKRLFVNHWYHTPYVMGAQAHNVIPATNDHYSAMSDFEFFANCYAEYFEDPAGAFDANRWGGKLPAGVKAFFKECVLGRNPYQGFKDKQDQKQKGK